MSSFEIPWWSPLLALWIVGFVLVAWWVDRTRTRSAWDLTPMLGCGVLLALTCIVLAGALVLRP